MDAPTRLLDDLGDGLAFARGADHVGAERLGVAGKLALGLAVRE